MMSEPLIQTIIWTKCWKFTHVLQLFVFLSSFVEETQAIENSEFKSWIKWTIILGPHTNHLSPVLLSLTFEMRVPHPIKILNYIKWVQWMVQHLLHCQDKTQLVSVLVQIRNLITVNQWSVGSIAPLNGRDSVYQEEGCQTGLDYSYSDPVRWWMQFRQRFVI